MATSIFLSLHPCKSRLTKLARAGITVPSPWKGPHVCMSREVRGSCGLRLQRGSLKGVFLLALLVWKQRERGRRFFLILAHVSLAQPSWSTHACGSSSQMPCQALGQYKHQVCLQYMQGKKYSSSSLQIRVCLQRKGGSEEGSDSRSWVMLISALNRSCCGEHSYFPCCAFKLSIIQIKRYSNIPGKDLKGTYLNSVG